MKHLSRLDIEAIAEKYITAYMELPEVQDMQIYRIEPELFLERVLGLKIDYAHLSYDGSLLGMTSFVEVNGFSPDLQNRQLAPVYQLSHCVSADAAGFSRFFDRHSHFNCVHNAVPLSKILKMQL